MTTPGDPNLRHLLARAVVVEQRVRRAVEARRLTDPDPDDAFRGLYLTDENVARLLDADEARAYPSPVPVPDPFPDSGSGSAPAPDFGEVPGERSGLTSLADEFGLTPLDVEILLITLVPDLDDRFEAFYGYLNDDVTRRRPSIGLALGLCGLSPADQEARGRLAALAP
ncbi:ATP-binding protein, partial [Streptomyces sp. NPDC059605]